MTTANILSQLGSPGVSTGFKNRFINGACTIDQRNAGASISTASASSGYGIDRWQWAVSQNSKMTLQQNAGSVTPPAGFTNYLGVTSSSAYSVLAGDYFLTGQPIEGLNVADLDWGTANAKTVTLSFWVRSSLTGTFGGSIQNSAQNRSYPFTYTISSANTWEQKSVTVPGDTSGTWLTTNGVGIRIWFGLGVGSTYSGTAGSWSGSVYLGATGATSVVGTNGATFYLTGIQLEVGTTATNFEVRSYGTELALCQRYYWNPRIDSSTYWWCAPLELTAYYRRYTARFPVTMRAIPTCTVSAGTNGSFISGSPLTEIISTSAAICNCDVTPTSSTNYYAYINSFTASAEL